jgi:hypothetical protein
MLKYQKFPLFLSKLRFLKYSIRLKNTIAEIQEDNQLKLNVKQSTSNNSIPIELEQNLQRIENSYKNECSSDPIQPWFGFSLKIAKVYENKNGFILLSTELVSF